jgi:3-hydroxyisobutyrate dehydrogenase-like beta-hydroxyacid dehydrogenase
MDEMRIAYLGLGVMGRGMVRNLLKADHKVTVWNRSPQPVAEFVELGATAADSPSAAAADADVIMYCLANDEAVEAVVFGPDGVLTGARAGQVAIDMSTIYPALSRKQAEAFAARGVDFLDAPVFGSKGEAAAGDLWVVIGGQREVFERVKPLLGVVSETTHYMGKAGSGASMKLVGNLVVAFQLEALGEALILATKAGLNPQDVLGVLHVTDFRSPIFDGVGASLTARDFSTAFALKHLLKDANLIARFAEEHVSPIPGAAAIREVIKGAMNRGWGEENASAMIKMLEGLGGTEVRG